MQIHVTGHQIEVTPALRKYTIDKLERTGFRTAVTLDAGIAELIKGFTMVKNTVHGNV